ncbi:hypothetical protein AC626_04815 [Pseudoalteromonas rubra]|uniref:Uncharacterized protein n=1 Tax=Pseudoalteromonas rubra TaxID=43658 RepID=A0A0L0EX73_9GAMM|nr:hypothetical protein AC626_04815 [Pseudoalteromonas rubra]
MIAISPATWVLAGQPFAYFWLKNKLKIEQVTTLFCAKRGFIASAESEIDYSEQAVICMK